MGAVLPKSPDSTMPRDQVEITREMIGLGPDPFASGEPGGPETAAETGFADQSIDRVNEPIEIFED